MPRRALLSVVVLSLVAASCGSGSSTPSTTVATTATTAPTTTTVAVDVGAVVTDLASLDFDAFVDQSYRMLTMRSPESVLVLGLEEAWGVDDARLDNWSLAFIDETHELERGVLDTLRSFDRDALTIDQQTTYDVYEWVLDLAVEGHRFAGHDYPVSWFLTSYNTGLIRFFTELHPLQTVADVEAYIARLEQIGPQVDQVIEGLEWRAANGLVPPDFSVQWTISVLEGDLSGIASSAAAPRAETLPLYTTLVERTEHLALDTSLLARAEEAVADGFAAGWQRLLAHLRTIEGRPTIGASSLPNGESFYQYALRQHTTTDMTAEEIHEMGLREVERVTDEMRAVFEQLDYPADADLGTLRARARRDGGFLSGNTPETEANLLRMFEDMVAVATDESRRYFSRIPASEMEIVPEPVGQGGYYVRGSADGSRPGAYHAGVQGSNLPRYTMATILYHEATPGHHFQISLAQELELPDVRRFETFTGYVEGWALYAERLAEEMGLYTNDPYGDIGRLELELLRAVRLVTDTGIHRFGWTRDEARSYIAAAMGDQAWVREVERYIAWPGQATAYMIGQQEILRLREQATADLGDAFDIVAFHDAVLLSGSLPLPVLETVVQEAMGG